MIIEYATVSPMSGSSAILIRDSSNLPKRVTRLRLVSPQATLVILEEVTHDGAAHAWRAPVGSRARLGITLE
jgi:hypothetical protein